MRVESKAGVGTAAGPVRRGPSGRFSLGEETATRAATGSAAAVDLGGIDALLVLQGEGDPAERRRRQARRGRDLLDCLDRLKAALLAGRIPLGDLDRLRAILAQRREATDDPALDDVLAQIEIRAEVELAKLAR